MRLLKKLLLILLATLGALLAGLALAAVALIAQPQWFLTSRTVARAVQVFGAPWQPRWTAFNFDISSSGFSEKQIGLRVRDLCFENAAEGIEGCVKDLDVLASVRLYFWGAKLKKISRFSVSGDRFTLDRTVARPGAAPKKSAGLPTSLPGLLPAALRGFTLEALSVDLPGNTIIGASGRLKAELQLKLDPGSPGPVALKVKVEQSSGTVTRHYSGEATLDSDLLKGRELTYLEAQGRLKAEGVDGSFQASVRGSGPDALAFSLNAKARLPGRRLSASATGSQRGQDLRLSGSGGVWVTSGPVKSVQLKRFALEALLKKDSTDWDRLKLDTAFEVETAIFGVKGAGRILGKTLEGRLTVSALSTPGILERDHFNSEVRLTVKPVKAWYEFQGGFDARVSGRASRLGELKVSHRLEFGLKVARFEDLVAYLARTRYSVPAPLNVFHGPLALSLKGAGDSGKEVQELEYALVSGLAQGRQALKFEAKGKLTAAGLWAPGRSFKNETDVLLQEVALQLPRFDLKGMAAFVPDSRIKTGAEADKADLARAEARKPDAKILPPPMLAEFRVKTAKPVILYSNLAKDPVPVGLDVTVRVPGGTAGRIEIKPFRVDIFRRVASVDHVTFTGRAGSPVMDLDGLIVYKTAEARIFIRLLGTAQKPRVKFESDPPMNQADIMAMLLFGKTPGDLDSDQQASAANTQTAVSNSAFGLASLYLLASTPVEYVGYDPVSRTYSIKFRLPGGATLQMGSDGQSRGVQLRKRLASNLAIQTELTSTQAQGNVVTTLLEWYGRR